MGKMERKTKFFIITLSICLTFMMLTGTILILPTSTWLSKSQSYSNTTTATVAKAGIGVLNNTTDISSATNILNVSDISMTRDYYSQAVTKDEKSNSAEFSAWASVVFNNAWVTSHLKGDTTYTISYTIEMTDIRSDATNTYDLNKGFLLYSGVSGFSAVDMGRKNTAVIKGNFLIVTASFKTPTEANLKSTTANYRILGYTARWTNSSGSGVIGKCKFHNIFLAEESTAKAGNYTLQLGAVSTATSATNLKVKNTGTAPELVRLYYSIKTLDNETTLTSADADVSFNSDFIAHERLDTAWAGYLYYNKALAKDGIISPITSITAKASMANKPVIIQISAECVLYAGNAYTVGDTANRPWTSVPSSWFCIK